MAHDRARAVLSRPLPPPPLGACFLPVVEGYLGRMSPGSRVLEIGCGTWSRIREHAREVGAGYEAVDSQATYYGRPVVATRVENLADLSFPDEAFDLVLGSQTMEHWQENGCPLAWGLHQCFRVCKTGGRVLLNVPIHFHGARDFMFGRIGNLRRLFARYSRTVRFEEWGRPSDPLPPCRPYPRYGPLRHRDAFILDMQAVKDRPLPRAVRRRAPGGLLGKILARPAGFTMHTLAERLRGVPERS